MVNIRHNHFLYNSVLRYAFRYSLYNMIWSYLIHFPMSSQITISVLVIAIGVTVLLAVTSKVTFSQVPSVNDTSVNDTQNKSAVDNQTMMMLAGTMTFGSSLDNARMHLMEAIMDLNEGDIKGAIMQLNMTDQGIKMHEKEMMVMKNSMKPNMSTTTSNKTQNESS